ncbi:MAG: TolC family protein [Gemmataceae bacterium]|nr:TolC family protein [Gemmataceae bacterium]
MPPPKANPDRPVRHLTLQEAIAIALEQGTTGFLTLAGGLGQANENVQSGRGGTFSDSIRVLAFDPAIAGADIEAALAKFDTRLLASQTWNKRDDAPLNVLTNFQNGDGASFSTSLVKGLATGGVAGITYSVDYLLAAVNNGFFINPSYRSRLLFQFEQPLLQNYGVEINQLLPNHPGSVQVPRFRPAGGGRTEGILVTRVRFEQAKSEFERNVNHMLLNVEAAYWNLWSAYGTLRARDEALVSAYNVWRNLEARMGLTNPPDLHRARAQFEAFRVARFQALGQVIENERQLRILLGMNDDGTRLVPVDSPTLTPFEPDWQAAVQEALNNRPELVQARQDLKVRQFDILVQRNLLKPDLRFVANYDLNGVGDSLAGPTFDATGVFNNSMGVLALNKFNNWQFGFQLDVPIGFRDAHSALRVARLNLLRSFAALRDNERKVLWQLRNQYSRLVENHRTIQAQYAQVQAAERQRENLEALFREGAAANLPVLLEQILSADRTLNDARAALYRAIADYNTTLAAYQFAKGTIMQYDNVLISEGPLPECAQVRATEHFRERTAALVAREREQNPTLPSGVINIEREPIPGLEPLRMDAPPSVLQMWSQPPQGVAAPNGGSPMPMSSFPARTPSPDLLPSFRNVPPAAETLPPSQAVPR